MQDSRTIEAGSLFRNRPFMLLWVAQAISQTAQNGIFFVLMVVITEATGSATYLSLLVLSTILPSVLFGLAAGVIVDRQSKRLILIGSNVFRAVLVVGYLGADDNLAIIYLVNLVFATISQFFAPAELSTIALLVRKSQLMRANGFFNLTFTASQFAGLVFPVPVVVKIFGTYWALVAMAGTYVVATVLVAFLPKDVSARASNPGQGFLFGLWAELKEGWAFIRSKPIISFAMLNMTTATTLILVLSVVAAPFVKKIVGIRADDAVYILAPAGLGVGLGAVLSHRLAKAMPSPRLINSAMIVFAVCLLGFGSTNWVGRYLAFGLSETAVVQWLLAAVIPLAFLMGLAFALITIPAQTLLQVHSPADMRGKIFATQLTMGNVASVLPILFIGGLADIFGIAQVIILVGIAVLGIGLFSMKRYHWLSASSAVSHHR